MIPEPTPVAVPFEKRPWFVAISEVIVTTEFFAFATTAVMSSLWIVVGAPDAVAAVLALVDAAGAAAGADAAGRVSPMRARVEPDASVAERIAAANTVPIRRRRDSLPVVRV